MLHKNIKYCYKIVIIKRKNKIKKRKHNSHARKCQFSKYALKELLKKLHAILQTAILKYEN